MNETPRTLHWVGGIEGHLVLIDQTKLPSQLVEIPCHDVESAVEAIRSLRVRGAPAIGIAAAYGVCLGLQTVVEQDRATLLHQLEQVSTRLAESRPTAVNLFWALQRMKRVAGETAPNQAPRDTLQTLLTEAHTILEEDRQMCRAIGRHGAPLLNDQQGVLTHCNAGGLATSDYGTALAVLYAAHDSGKQLSVYVDETRPLLQGSRLTAWELMQRGMDVTVICDSMAAQVLRERRVQAVITGADRIAANGDTANKIGTYGLALAAAAHKVPLYIAAPTSTFDLSILSGDQIPIECRGSEEITHGFGIPTAPEGVKTYNPAFNVTPAPLIKAIICERGIIQPVTSRNIAEIIH